MRTLFSLIDEAAKVCGSRAALARRLGTTPQRMHQYHTGERPMTPETVAELCDVTELDAEEARRLVALAIVANPKNASRAAVLRRALFVCWALGVSVPATLLPTPSDARTLSGGVTRLTVYTLWIVRLALLLLPFDPRRTPGGVSRPRAGTGL